MKAKGKREKGKGKRETAMKNDLNSLLLELPHNSFRVIAHPLISKEGHRKIGRRDRGPLAQLFKVHKRVQEGGVRAASKGASNSLGCRKEQQQEGEEGC